jgi:hypothetical protein
VPPYRYTFVFDDKFARHNRPAVSYSNPCRRSRNPPGVCSSYPAVGSGPFLADRAVVVVSAIGSWVGRRVDR